MLTVLNPAVLRGDADLDHSRFLVMEVLGGWKPLQGEVVPTGEGLRELVEYIHSANVLVVPALVIRFNLSTHLAEALVKKFRTSKIVATDQLAGSKRRRPLLIRLAYAFIRGLRQ